MSLPLVSMRRNQDAFCRQCPAGAALTYQDLTAAADGGVSCGCADGRMMQIWEVPTEETFRLAAAGEGYRLTLLPDR